MSGTTHRDTRLSGQGAGEHAGRHALVTGAAGGIGAATVQSLLARGAHVTAWDTQADGLAALVEAAGPQADRLRVATVDVCDHDAVQAACGQAFDAFGDIDLLACVAGILQMGRVVDLSPSSWQRTLEVNATGAFHVCQWVARRMMDNRRGAIVIVSSNAATTPRAGMGAYAASKAALTQLARCLALEVAEYGVRCNIVSPGSTDTEMQRAMWRAGSSREAVIEGSLPGYRLGIPLRKIATPQDVADAMLFLLSDQAGHITLHDLRVDGGATLDQ